MDAYIYILIGSLFYHRLNYLVQHAKSFITFTVGNNEELIISGIPYLTTFVNTEKPETIARGKHIL